MNVENIELLIKKISEVEFTNRTHNALTNYGLTLIGEIAEKGPIDLLRIPNLGKNSVDEINLFFIENGIKFYTDIRAIENYFNMSLSEIRENYSHLDLNNFIEVGIPEVNKNISDPNSITIGANHPLESKLFLPLSGYDLSVRVQNYFKNNNLKYIGDLVQLTSREISRSNNVGRGTIDELNDFLKNHNLRLGIQLIGWPPENFDELKQNYENLKDPLNDLWTSENPDFNSLEDVILKDLEAFIQKLDTRQKKIFHQRLGYKEPLATLEELGSHFNITRERVRQIEAALLRKLYKCHSLKIDKLRDFLTKYQHLGFIKIFPKFSNSFKISSKSFKEFLRSNISLVLEKFTNVQSGYYKTPELAATLVFNDFNKIQSVYSDLIFPISKEDYAYELSKLYNFDYNQALNSIFYLTKLDLIIEDQDQTIYPKKITKRDEILAILNKYPKGIEQIKLYNQINNSPSNNFIEKFHSSFAVGAIDESEYIYCGKSKIKAVKFGNQDSIDLNEILPTIESTLNDNQGVSNLKEIFQVTKAILPKNVDIYDLRYVIKNHGSEYGIFFSGRSQGQTVSLGKKIRYNHKQELENKIKKSKYPINKIELEERFSGVSQLLKTNLSELVNEGVICRYDVNEWCSNEYAYRDIQDLIPEIKKSLLDVVTSKKYSTLTFVINYISEKLSIYESRYFIESLLRKIIYEEGLEISIKHETVTQDKTSKGIMAVIEDNMDESLSVQINYEKILSILNISFQQYKNAFGNVKYYKN